MGASLDDMVGDDDYPAYTMGRAAEIVGTTQAFLRSLDEAKLIAPHRCAGGHRRYSRYQLRLVARARELADQGIALDAACRIIILEDQLDEAQRLNQREAPTRGPVSRPPDRVSHGCLRPLVQQGSGVRARLMF